MGIRGVEGVVGVYLVMHTEPLSKKCRPGPGEPIHKESLRAKRLEA